MEIRDPRGIRVPQEGEINGVRTITGTVSATTTTHLRERGIKPGDSYSLEDASPAVRAALEGNAVLVNVEESKDS